jgi:hypothetical protein
MSHELRTPLNAIIGLTEMMVSNAARFGTEKGAGTAAPGECRWDPHRLSLINEVLDLSKIEAGKLELNPEPVNLARLIDEVIGTAGQLAEKNRNRHRRSPREPGRAAPQILFRRGHELSRTMHVPAAERRLPDLQALNDLALERGTHALHVLDAILSGRWFQLSQTGDAELFVKLEDLVRTQSRDGKHLQHAFRNLSAHALQRQVAAGPVQFRDDVGDRIADARNLAQPAFRDDALDRLGERRQALRGPQISFGTIGIAACERRAAAVHRKKLRNTRCIERDHRFKLGSFET